MSGQVFKPGDRVRSVGRLQWHATGTVESIRPQREYPVFVKLELAVEEQFLAAFLPDELELLP